MGKRQGSGVDEGRAGGGLCVCAIVRKRTREAATEIGGRRKDEVHLTKETKGERGTKKDPQSFLLRCLFFLAFVLSWVAFPLLFPLLSCCSGSLLFCSAPATRTCSLLLVTGRPPQPTPPSPPGPPHPNHLHPNDLPTVPAPMRALCVLCGGMTISGVWWCAVLGGREGLLFGCGSRMRGCWTLFFFPPVFSSATGTQLTCLLLA